MREKMRCTAILFTPSTEVPRYAPFHTDLQLNLKVS